MATLPVTDILARFAAETGYSTISQIALSSAKLHMLDSLGAALAAVRTPIATIAFDYCKLMGDSSAASIWGTDRHASAPMAAFTNGLLAHALDFDDWDAYRRAGHPTSMITASVLALAESRGATGRELLKAYILGIEILTHIASGTPDLHKRGFHSTPVWGSIGSVIAAAVLLRLGPEKIKAALGIAASGAAGIQRQQGSMVKPFHAGNAARNGVEAALLAERGFTADSAIIEAPRGFCDTFFGAGTCDYEKMVQDLGSPYFLEAPGLGLKMHPCSAPQFLAADGALLLKRQHDIRIADVAKITVSIPPHRYERHYHPEIKTGLRGKFAVNYVVALCLLDGKLENDSFTDAKANDPAVQAALKAVQVNVDEAIPEPGTYCPVTVELRDGRRFSHTATIAKGHPENPLTHDEVIAKFRNNAQASISPEQAHRLTGAMDKLEEVQDVCELVNLLRVRERQ